MSIDNALINGVMKIYQSKGVGKFFSINFLDEQDGEFVFEVSFPADCLNPQGNVQGGMITSMLDDCTALCVLFSTKGKKFPNTTDFHTTFHRPLSHESVTIKSSILKIGKNIVSVEGKIFNGQNMLGASCLHTGFLFNTQGIKK